MSNKAKHWLKILAILFVAPLVIGVWCVTHPISVWREAKKSWFGKS